MHTPAESVEYETVLLSRYSLIPRLGRDGGRLDRSAVLLLRRLRIEGPQSLGQLSDAMGLDVSTINRQTAAIVRAGLAARVLDPEGVWRGSFR
ncbi:hypothetical protein ACWDYH_20510 [Nocardia goodfellowii]